jgi:hypothetical protein
MSVIEWIQDPGFSRGWVVSATPRPLYRRESDPVPIVQEARWALESVYMDPKNLAETGI